MKSVCIICGIEIESERRRKYCGQKCSSHSNYINHKQAYIDSARRYDKLHPEAVKIRNKKSFQKFYNTKRERFNELMNNNYYKHKDLHASRVKTMKVINCRKRCSVVKVCKLCGCNENLQIHHEVYPIACKEIRKAMDDGKIYYLCKECHEKIHKLIKIPKSI